jgi:hypothetical protein
MPQFEREASATSGRSRREAAGLSTAQAPPGRSPLESRGRR